MSNLSSIPDSIDYTLEHISENLIENKPVQNTPLRINTGLNNSVSNIDQLQSPTDRQNTKRIKTLLKIIGALVTSKYLKSNSGNKFKKGNNDAANIVAIAEDIHAQLTDAGFTHDGIKDRTLRSTIPEALEAIRENKE